MDVRIGRVLRSRISVRCQDLPCRYFGPPVVPDPDDRVVAPASRSCVGPSIVGADNPDAATTGLPPDDQLLQEYFPVREADRSVKRPEPRCSMKRVTRRACWLPGWLAVAPLGHRSIDR
jgi:hypothetical protein